MRELAGRVGRFRRVVLIPIALASAALAFPSYLFLREAQFLYQFRDGALVAFHVPLVTGVLAMVPAAIAFACGAVVYRRLRDRRIAEWKRELTADFDLPDGTLDEVGAIFH